MNYFHNSFQAMNVLHLLLTFSQMIKTDQRIAASPILYSMKCTDEDNIIYIDNDVYLVNTTRFCNHMILMNNTSDYETDLKQCQLKVEPYFRKNMENAESIDKVSLIFI